ncbi:MAG: Valine-tRNA ligase [Candidatus Jorgensenbacteria bacterium GW2011_GWA1_48_11]|uniref:Valine--tRNA ligase n=1 Tax=Candidatus Jorgensenbacteria bacterium GW2011_GWA1_48_11 TaxID=1618660 RepID=A0A0G1WMT5_9BACT|nr:MAG: Valine-tRNA ligase [Candidatus Jorgensenbacteria bacterium GW2011_GWA1_48_11]KKW12125.1 MAG: Valine-tRNA ligase [Candidatus Jorgensenbacteria bacterium GW2011_GWB1_49_9]
MFDKPYDPKLAEPKIYEKWLKSGYFNPDNLPGKRSKNYIVYMPLPNITGSLHMGHALDNTAPDILIRYHRMRGRRTLWLPGTDHAGISTQYVVEKELKKEGKSRFDLGREKFIERVWEWKEKYGGIILDQLKKLGVSADWSRTRFTLDPAYAEGVKKAFLYYYKKGWIYQGLRTVNWCPRCGTSLSELELEYKDEKTFLWHIKYADGLIVATTRPETMLGDTAVAVNPKDKRYSKWIGRKITLPITEREIPVIADKAIDMDFGTGAVKVTPAHDVLDFEIGQRHKLETIQVIDERGRMSAQAGEYQGMKTEEARQLIVARLKNEGRLAGEEPYEHRVAVCYRSGNAIEPIPSNQWFLKMGELAKMALAAVKTKKVKIQPKNFERSYFDWLGNIRDWTISRQIWWGHQLPIWFCKKDLVVTSGSVGSYKDDDSFKEDGKKRIYFQFADKFIVAENKPKQCPFCKNCKMERAADVLDTWFSSALWPFAGLSEADVKKYYPGDLVSNAREILNLWDARMIFSGLEFKGEVPFKNVLIHGTILTKEGKRMSKSLGTGIDPMHYINQFGADATRFAVVWQATQQDIRWDETAVTAGRKFANKIWNASRFVLENKPSRINADFNGLKQIKNLTPADKKIIAAAASIKKKTEKYIETFEFSKALRGLYDFFWHDFCDTYLEKSKAQLQDEKTSESTKQILNLVLRESLKTLHPFLPFVTEEIWSHLPDKNLLIVTEW